MTHDDRMPSRLTRRQALARGTGGLLAVSALPTFLAACGGSSDGGTGTATSASTTSGGPTPADQVTGDLVLLGYPDWYGPNEFKDFHQKYPNATVKNTASGLSGQAQQIAQITQNKGSYDLTLAGPNVAEQSKLAGLLAPLDASAVPNVERVGQPFRDFYTWGVPTDYGKVGYAYRKDLISERPTTWKEFWDLAAKYKGKTTLIKYDSDIQGSALKSLGYSINTKNESELEQMQKALLQLKPNIKAIIDTDYSKALVQGTASMAVDYDYDIALAQQKNDNIVWVQPEEGVAAYIEGWAGLKDSQHLPAVWALMDFHLEPKNYAGFINSVGCSYVMPDVEPFLKKSIATNPVLKYDPDALEKIEFEAYLGPEETAKRGKLWEEFLAA